MEQGNSHKPQPIRGLLQLRSSPRSIDSILEEFNRIGAEFHQHPPEAYRAYCYFCEELRVEMLLLGQKEDSERWMQLFHLTIVNGFPVPIFMLSSSPDDEVYLNANTRSPVTDERHEIAEIRDLAENLCLFINVGRASHLIRFELLDYLKIHEKKSRHWHALGGYAEGISNGIANGVDKWPAMILDSKADQWACELKRDVYRVLGNLYNITGNLYNVPTGNEEADLTGLLDSLDDRFRTLVSLDFSALQEAEGSQDSSSDDPGKGSIDAEEVDGETGLSDVDANDTSPMRRRFVFQKKWKEEHPDYNPERYPRHAKEMRAAYAVDNPDDAHATAGDFANARQKYKNL